MQICCTTMAVLMVAMGTICHTTTRPLLGLTTATMTKGSTTATFKTIRSMITLEMPLSALRLLFRLLRPCAHLHDLADAAASTLRASSCSHSRTPPLVRAQRSAPQTLAAAVAHRTSWHAFRPTEGLYNLKGAERTFHFEALFDAADVNEDFKLDVVELRHLLNPQLTKNDALRRAALNMTLANEMCAIADSASGTSSNLAVHRLALRTRCLVQLARA
jgi:hypothetical protein